MRFLVSTTQRCGSTWLTNLLEKALGARRVRYIDGAALGFRFASPTREPAIRKFAASLAEKSEHRVFKSHDIPSKDFDAVCAALPELRILTIHREFRDVLVSRYFYYRYYWPTEPSLGELGEPLAQFFGDVSALSDEDAISCLVNSPIPKIWYSEWKAFEGEFNTPNAMRLAYADMLSGEARPSLAAFIRSTLPVLDSFEKLQEEETATYGRTGQSRFYRHGGCGQWKRWLTVEDAATVDRLLQ